MPWHTYSTILETRLKSGGLYRKIIKEILHNLQSVENHLVISAYEIV